MRHLAIDVAWSACLSLCLLVKSVSPAKTDEPIEMPFGLWTRVGPRDHVLCGGPDPQGEGTIWSGVVPYRKCICNSASAENG